MLLKIAVNGITVQDYVKKLQESDILVAVDGKIYRDGPAKLREIFESRRGAEAKWLLSFYRDGQIFELFVLVDGWAMTIGSLSATFLVS